MRNFFAIRSFSLVGSLLPFAVDLLGGGIRIEQKELSEEELAQRMSRGDDHAFEVLYERYFDQIFRFTIKRVGGHEIAEDLVSAIFLKVFVARNKFSHGSFKAWIYRIANNAIIDFYRTNKSTVTFDSEIHTVQDPNPAVSEQLDAQSLRHLLEHVLSKLDTRSQLVLQLKFFSELSHEEIALTMKISTNHVGVLVYRALQKCAKFFPENIKL